jgi:hypothetical protein
MADYQSLLTRAVANLPNASTATARHAIYDRARVALVTQLRSLRPPLPDSDVEREERALDKAIAQVESQFMPTDAPREAPDEARLATPQPSAPSRAPAPPAAPRPAEFRAPAAPAPAPSAPQGAPPQAPATKPSQPAPAVAAAATTQPRPGPSRPPAPTAPPQRPPAPPSARPPGPPAAKPAAPPAATAAVAAHRAAPNGAKPPPVQVALHPNDRANANAAPPVTLAKSDSGAAAPANLAKVAPGAQANHAESRGAPPIIASLSDDAGPATVAPVAPVDVERVGLSKLESEGQRPFAPTAIAEKRQSWPWLVLAVLLGVVLSIAVAAILMRQKPQDLAIAPPPEQQQEAPQGPAKIAQRAQPSPAEDKSGSAPASPAPGAGEPQAGQAAQSGQAAPPPEAQNPNQLPAAGRAAMLIASPDNPQKPVVNLGSTVWSTIPAAPGEPASVALKADADIPDLKMHATMILRKNTDPTLEATHTIDLKFSFAEGAPITGFKDVGLPQMRMLDSTASETLNSVKVKISDVYFLIALAKSDQALARNVDLMKTRAWFDFPLLLNDDRIAKLVFQKSADGEAMLEKAFDAWK